MSMLDGIRTAAEFTQFKTDADAYKETPEYLAQVAAEVAANSSACCGHLMRQIKTFLNQDNMTANVPTSAYFYAGNVNPDHVSQIITDLTNAGYTATLDDVGRLHITLA